MGDPFEVRIMNTWMKDSTLNRWRHDRILGNILPLVRPGTSILTIGDGRYGTDANYIERHGGSAHATDIFGDLLEKGKEAGFISSCGIENAEALSFPDNHFDYVLIKEALHHLPRPWLALYEASRVCRVGVILIEPHDDISIVGRIKMLIKKIVLFKSTGFFFEQSGNFVYTVSHNELCKFQLGFDRTIVAFKYMYDHYEPGVEFNSIDATDFQSQAFRRRLRWKFFVGELLLRLGLSNGSLLGCVLFKNDSYTKEVGSLVESGWSKVVLPINPYKEI